MAGSTTKTRPEGRKKPKQARSKLTVESILDAASQVLVRDGYAKASTTRVAQVAGVSVGSLYQYFRSKQALFAAIVEREAERFSAQLLAKAAAHQADSLATKVRVLVDVVLDHKRNHPKLHNILEKEVPWDICGPVSKHVHGQAQKLVKALLSAHADEIRPKDLDTAAFVLVQAVDGVANRACAEPPKFMRSESLTEETVDLVLGYLGLHED